MRKKFTGLLVLLCIFMCREVSLFGSPLRTIGKKPPPVVCTQELTTQDPPLSGAQYLVSPPQADQLREIRSALADLRIKSAPDGLSIGDFKNAMREIAAYLLGQTDSLQKNPFYNPRDNQLEVSATLSKAAGEEAELVLPEAVAYELQHSFERTPLQGKKGIDAIHRLQSAPRAFFFTHMTPEHQQLWKELYGKIGKNWKDAPATWLLSPEYSPLLPGMLFQFVQWAQYSNGGEFGIALPYLTHAVVGGGFFEDCLPQTIASIAGQSRQSQLTIEILLPVSYTELDAETVSLAELFGAEVNESEREDLLEEFGVSLSEELSLFGWYPDEALGGLFTPGKTLAFRDETSRTLKLRYVEAKDLR